MPVFHDQPVALMVAVFVASAAMVWIAGTRLALLGDEIAERFQLTRAFVGLIFLATATELPEIVTSLTAAHLGNASLVLGNMFGGITMQTAILAVADVLVVKYALTSWPRKSTHALLAVMLMVLLSLLLAVSLLRDLSIGFNIGLGALLVSLAYPVTIALLRAFDEKDSWAPVDLPEIDTPETAKKFSSNGFEELSARALLTQAVISSLVILLAGIALALSANSIAENTHLGSSFVGITLLAAATSMPELSTTIAAARIGAYTMAISNIMGSNLIMLALIFPADIAYRSGPILSEVGPGAQFSLVVGILVTGIYAAGLLMRRTPRLFNAGLDSWLVIFAYVTMLIVLYPMQ